MVLGFGLYAGGTALANFEAERLARDFNQSSVSRGGPAATAADFRDAVASSTRPPGAPGRREGGLASEQSDVGAAILGQPAAAAATGPPTAAATSPGDQIRNDLAPYREIGQRALFDYAALQGIGPEGQEFDSELMEKARSRFTETPGYQFRFDEGLRALDRSAAARGGLRGGAHERELVRYGQGIASDEFDTYANRLAGLASAGQQSAVQTGTLGIESARQVASERQGDESLRLQELGLGQNADALRASSFANIGAGIGGTINNLLLFSALSGGGLF